MSGPFLGNSSVNKFPQQQTQTQQKKSRVFCVVRAKMLYAMEKKISW
jgi:hypothetical protein